MRYDMLTTKLNTLKDMIKDSGKRVLSTRAENPRQHGTQGLALRMPVT